MLDNFPLCSSLALAGRIPREPSQRAPFYEPGSPGALRGLRALPGFFGRPAAKLGPVEAPKAVRHIAFGCSPCPKQCRTWPMFVASVDLFLPQSQGSIHQCCHDPIPWTGGRRHQPMGIEHQLHRFTRDYDGGVHSIYRAADRVFAAAGVEAGEKKRGLLA